MNTRFDSLWYNGKIVTAESEHDVVANDSVGVKDGKICWVGNLNQLSERPAAIAVESHDLGGKLLTPGLIDCHTHLVYAGNRAHEFEQRLKGATYAEIASQGGGIQFSVKATRAATEAELMAQSLPRAKALMMSGATTLEIKSGYGLDWETEAKMLRVAKRIGEELSISVHRTFLGAHTVPVEYKQKPDEYVRLVCEEMIPRIASEELAEAVDVFCESIAFSIDQAEKIFKAASEHQLKIKCHAEQLTNQGAAKLAARYHALSVDHLEFLAEEDVDVLAHAGTVAVLLPGAFYYLRETTLPPIDALRKALVPIAIASDCNPGTSPILSLPLIMNMACTLFRLTPQEALRGLTINAAKALGIDQRVGSIEVGKDADFAIWDVGNLVDIIYYVGQHRVSALVKKGKLDTQNLLVP